VETLTDTILCLCYNTDFCYRQIWKMSILWWWHIIRNFTLYVNHVHSCCKSLLPPFPIMNYIPYIILCLTCGKDENVSTTPLLIVMTEGGWVVSAPLPTRSMDCMNFRFPAHPYHSSSGLCRPLFGSPQFTSREMSKFYCWRHLASPTRVSFPWPIQRLFYSPPLSLSSSPFFTGFSWYTIDWVSWKYISFNIHVQL